MKKLSLILLITILLVACKKSDNPQPNNSTATNNPPVLPSNLSYTATTASTLQIDLSNKITDANGDSWSITNANASHGAITVSSKIISYTPNSGYTGNDTISITIQDSKGNIGTGKIAITVSNSSPTNHAPTFTSTTTMVISDGTFKNFTLPVSDADNDPISIVGITGASSNISITYSGLDITITPNNSVFAGSETLSITITDGTSPVTSTFTVNVGEQSQIDTYNMLAPFFGVSLTHSDIGTCTLNKGSITTTMTQASGGFFNGATSAGTYTYKILSSGNVEFIVGANKIEYTVSVSNVPPYGNILIFIKVNTGDTYNLY